MLKKIIARKIICSTPISVTNFGYWIKDTLGLPLDKIDSQVQVWSLIQSENFSEEDWRDIQLEKLKTILNHAYINVPYWRDLFNKIKFSPNTIKSFEDLKKIPASSRTSFKKKSLIDLTATNVAKRRFVTYRTSGSTGEPFQFYLDRRQLFRRYVNTVYGFRSMGIVIGDPILILGLTAHVELNHIGRRVDVTYLEDELLRKEFVYPLIINYKPKLIYSTPTYLERLLIICKRDGFRTTIPKIYYVGESLDISLKNELESYFLSKVYCFYGLSESGTQGLDCRYQKLHRTPWMSVMEIVNGEIIITSFENEVMPFLRYSPGDTGEWLSERCPCGKNTKLLELKGRAKGSVDFHDGSAYPIQLLIGYLAKNFFNEIIKFQFVQHSTAVLFFNYIPKTSEERSLLEQKLEKYFKETFSNKIEVRISSVEFITPNSRGKTSLFVKNIKYTV